LCEPQDVAGLGPPPSEASWYIMKMEM